MITTYIMKVRRRRVCYHLRLKKANMFISNIWRFTSSHPQDWSFILSACLFILFSDMCLSWASYSLFVFPAQELGNNLEKCKNNETLQQILTNATIMVVSVTASTTQGWVDRHLWFIDFIIAVTAEGESLHLILINMSTRCVCMVLGPC